LHKIGIGTVGKDKGYLERLIQDGWTVQGMWHHRDKHTTFQWEIKVFSQLQSKVAQVDSESPAFLGKRDKHWVENISAQAISATDLAHLMSTVVSGK